MPVSRGEQEAMLRRLPDVQRRQAALFKAWSDATNAVEDGHPITQVGLDNLNLMAQAIAESESDIEQLTSMLTEAINQGVIRRQIPDDSLRTAGLSGFVVLGLVLIAFLATVLPAIYWLTHQHAEENQARAKAFYDIAIRNGAIPTDPNTTATIGGAISGAITTIPWLVAGVVLLTMFSKRVRHAW